MHARVGTRKGPGEEEVCEEGDDELDEEIAGAHVGGGVREDEEDDPAEGTGALDEGGGNVEDEDDPLDAIDVSPAPPP